MKIPAHIITLRKQMNAPVKTVTLDYFGQPFTGSRKGHYLVQVTGSAVKVYDDVADAYTSCHALSGDDCTRLILAAQAGIRSLSVAR